MKKLKEMLKLEIEELQINMLIEQFKREIREDIQEMLM